MDEVSALPVWSPETSVIQDKDSIRGCFEREGYHLEPHRAKSEELFAEFFSERSEVVDCAIILDSGILAVYYLRDFYDQTHFIGFRPFTSKKHHVEKWYVDGDLHKDRTLLMLEKDSVTGASVIETAIYFASHGYDVEDMFVYLQTGSVNINRRVESLLLSLEDFMQHH
jgi:hypothetical protein